MTGADVIKRTNLILRKCLRLATLYRFQSKLKQFKKKFPEYFKPLDKNLEHQHKAYWADLSKRIDIDYIRLYCNFSGVNDYKYVPINIFYAIVEPLLNDANYARWYSDKNNLDRIITKTDCPKSYLKNIHGVFLDGEHRIISPQKAEEIFILLNTDVIIKPTTGYAFQGRSVLSVQCKKEGKIDSNNQQINFKLLHKTYKQDYIVQEKIKQHEEYARFNPSSTNSFRIITYRSIKTEEIHIITCLFKIGRSGQIADNTACGGLLIGVNEHGKLNEFAYTNDGKIWKHPDSGLIFGNIQLPFIQEMRATAKKAAQKFPSHRILALDIAIDKNGNPRVLEVNLKRIGDPQFIGGTFFKTYTDELKEFCLDNKDKNDFRVIQF